MNPNWRSSPLQNFAYEVFFLVNNALIEKHLLQLCTKIDPYCLLSSAYPDYLLFNNIGYQQHSIQQAHVQTMFTLG